MTGIIIGDQIEYVFGKDVNNFTNITIFVDNELNYIIENKDIPEIFSRFLNGFFPYPRHTDWFKVSYPLYTTQEFQSLDFLKSITLPGRLNTFGSLLFEDALREASLFSLN